MFKNLTLYLLLQIPGSFLFSQGVYIGTTMGFTDHLEKNCGIVFKENGIPTDPFISISEHGANIVRFRIGFPPYSSSYSNGEIIDLESPAKVKAGMQRAKNAGLKSLLSFSYQSFALEDSQKLNDYVAPLAWQSFASNTNQLADSVYSYTYDILDDYCASGLIPEIVAIGNESVWRRMEPNIPENQLPAYSPQRSVTLHNAGSQAVRDISEKYNVSIKVCFHLMDPAKTEWWLNEHTPYGLNCDMIGISLYHDWTHNNYGSYNSLGQFVSGITSKSGKDLIVMETAQLFTSGGNDNHVDILGAENIPDGYPNPPTTETQKNYLIDITNEVLNNGGCGVLVWGGEWVASDCFIYADPWGAGSSWENKAFWDFNYNLHDGVNWMVPFSGMVPVVFKVSMEGADVSKGVFIKGDIRSKNGKTREYIQMHSEGNNIYSYTSYIPSDSTGGYYFLNDSSESARETIPSQCALFNGDEREFIIPADSKGEVFITAWSGCDTIRKFKLITHVIGEGNITPATGTYAENTEISLNASPVPGWDFTGWSGDITGVQNPISILMDSEKNITANFTERQKVILTFKVDMTGISIVNGVYVTGEFQNLSGQPWMLNKMIINEGNNIYSYSTWAHTGESGAYYFLNANNWEARENVPGSCVGKWNTDRKYVVSLNDTVFAYKWGSCIKAGNPQNSVDILNRKKLTIFPNPLQNKEINFRGDVTESLSFQLTDLSGRVVFSSSGMIIPSEESRFHLPGNIKNGLYIIDVLYGKKRFKQKIIIQ